MDIIPLVISGNSNKALAEKVAACLDVVPGQVKVKRFSDGEIQVEIEANVRGRDVFVVQSTCTPVNENLLELLIMIDALKRASARSIAVVMPYYGYSRQDRKVAPRAPITAKLVADLITTAGANRVLTVDLHAGQIQGFFDIPVDNLYASPLMADYFRRYAGGDLVVVSPDAGGVERARSFAKRLDVGLAIIDKRRATPNQSEVMNIIGSVEGKDVIMIDDMIDTAGTLCNAAAALKQKGVNRIFACASHAVFSGPAIERIEASSIDEVVVTDTIPLRDEAACNGKIKTVSVAGLLGEAIKRITSGQSLSALFN